METNAIDRPATRRPAMVARLNHPEPSKPRLEDSRELRVLLGACLAQTRVKDEPDLSQRQLAVLLTTYLGDGPHTVRGLAQLLGVSKPAITRALDRLGEFDLTRRKVDPSDRRSLLVQRTLKGAAYLRRLDAALDAAGIEADAALAERRAARAGG